MKNISYKLLVITITVFLLTSCSEPATLLKVDVVESNDGKALNFVPNMEFKQIERDSITKFFTKADLFKTLGGDLKKGNLLSSTTQFDLYAMSLSNYGGTHPTFQIFLRSISKEGKIIDSHILGVTTETPAFSGSIDNNGKITRTYSNGDVERYELLNDGTFTKVTTSDE